MASGAPGRMSHFLTTAIIDLQAGLFGYTVAFTGSTLSAMVAETDACGGDDDGLCGRGAFVAAVAPLAAAVASMVAGSVTDAVGRRRFLSGTSVLWFLGYATLACATDFAGLVAGRAIAGVAMGATSVGVPVYVTELAPPASRGPLGGLFNVFISTGIACVFALGVNGAGGGWWRYMAAFGCAPALASGACLALGVVPESPRWLASVGRAAAARHEAERIYGTDTKGALALVEDACGVSPAPKGGDPGVDFASRNVLAGVGVVVCFVASGNNVVQAYMTIILESAGCSPSLANVGALTFAATQLAGAVAMCARVIDAYGRRPLLLASACGSSLSLCGAALAADRGSGVLAIVFADCFIASLTLGLSTLSWVYAAEVFPDAVRGRAMAAATVAFWGCTFLSIELFDTVSGAISVPGVLGVFSGLCACSFAFVFFNVVETKNRSLDEVQALFRKQAPAGERAALLRV